MVHALFNLKNKIVMKKIALISFLVFSILSCNAQENEKDKLNTKKTPKESWSVNKEIDKDDNITKYDSVYTWSYSLANGDSNTVNLDSVMQSFDDYIKNNSLFDWSEHFSFFPKNDSLLMDNFFKEDYFLNQWNQLDFNIDKMMHEMYSLRNEFLEKQYPELIESKKEKNNHKIIAH